MKALAYSFVVFFILNFISVRFVKRTKKKIERKLSYESENITYLTLVMFINILIEDTPYVYGQEAPSEKKLAEYKYNETVFFFFTFISFLDEGLKQKCRFWRTNQYDLQAT